MRKIIATMLSMLTFALCLFCGGVDFAAQKKQVRANTTVTACTAVTKDYAAVAYGNELYLYYEHSGVWQTYTHSQPISTLHFDDNGTLYFLDEQTFLYTLNVTHYQEGETAQNTGMVCNTFFIDGNAMYHTRQTWFYEAPLSNLSAEKRLFNPSISSQALYFWEGDLYFLYGLNYLYKLSLGTARASEVAKLPENTTSFVIADGNFFGITSNHYFYAYPLRDISPSTSKPILEKTDCQALSAHEDEVFFMQNKKIYSYTKANGLQKATGAFARPLYNAIPAKDIQGALDKENPSFSVVQTEENALLIQVDIQTEEEIFPCLGITRSAPITALQIAQTEHFSVLSYQKEGETNYSTYLVAKSKVHAQDNWEVLYDTPKTGYITNQVHIMKYPRLGTASFDTPLQRGEPIALLGEVRGLERAYYKVQHGKTVGYLPKAYIADSFADNPQTETIVYGEGNENGNAIFQLAYILLGFALIAILSDYLLFRHFKLTAQNTKKRDE